jgi:hypothetical protein
MGLQTVEQTIGEARRRDPRLGEELERLQDENPSWSVMKTSLWGFSNTYVWRQGKVIFIDDDDEGLDTTVQWLKDGVKEVYRGDSGRRRAAISGHAALMAARTISGTTTALETLASTADFAAWYDTALSTFTADLSLVFTGGRARSLGVGWTVEEAGPQPGGVFIGDNAFFSQGKEWGSTGFQRIYRDATNQVRHAAFAMAVVAAAPNLGIHQIQAREPSGNADRRLNQAIRDIVISRPYHPRATFEADVATSRVGWMLRHFIGDPKERVPWDGPDDGITVP